MDVVLLSRPQFAAATRFHFLFVPLTHRIWAALLPLAVIFLVASAFNASSSPLTLKIMLIVIIICIPIVLAYQIWTYTLFKGKVTAEDLAYEESY